MSEKQGNTSPKRLNRKWGMVALMCGLPFFFLFAFVGNNPGRGRAAALCVALLVAGARARWDLKNHAWFWVTLTLMLTLDMPLVLLVPWSNKSYPGITLLPVAVLDYAIIYGSIRLAEKVANKTPSRCT